MWFSEDNNGIFGNVQIRECVQIAWFPLYSIQLEMATSIECSAKDLYYFRPLNEESNIPKYGSPIQSVQKSWTEKCDNETLFYFEKK